MGALITTPTNIQLSSKIDVSTPSKSYQAQAQDWKLIDDLLGGTPSMRAAQEIWLPRNPGESLQAYQTRVNRTFLYNGLKRTVRTLVGKPFSEDVHISKEITGDFAAYLNDVDMQGNDITKIAKKLATIGIAKGIVHLICDYSNSQPGPFTIAQKKELNIRPYFTVYDPDNVIGWHYVIEGGVPVLSQVRLKEDVVEPDGEWGEKVVQQVRVWDRIVGDAGISVTWRLFREMPSPGQQESTFQQTANGVISLKKIPLVTFYFGEQTGFMTAEPPLMDLAWLNVEHWQSSSEQRNILHVARVPMWFFKGYQPETDEEGGNKAQSVTFGPFHMIRSENPEADLKVVEHSGKGIDSGRNDLQDIEAHMAIMGAELLYKKAKKTQTTATEENHDDKAEDSELSSMIKAEEDGLTAAIGMMYEWENQTPPPGKLVTINTDFGLTPQDAADLQMLYQSRIAGQITHGTYLKELQRRGVLAPSLDLTTEETAAKGEGPVQLATQEPAQKTVKPGTEIPVKSGAGA